MKIVIFGASGYIGKQLVKTLLPRLEPTNRLTLVSRTIGMTSSKLADELGKATKSGPYQNIIDLQRGDLTDENSVRNLCKDANVIVNLVGIMEESLPKYSFDSVHIKGPSLLAEIVRQGQQSRLVHISAIGADSSSEIPYPKSKGLGEEAIRAALDDCQTLSSIIIRPGLVISPRDQFLNRFALLTKIFPVFPVFGTGTSLFQPILVEDLATIIANACLVESNKFASIGGVVTVEVGGRSVKQFKDIVYLTSRKPRFSESLRWLIPPYFVNIPVTLSLLMARILEFAVPKGSLLRLTRDQIRLLQKDNVVSGNTTATDNAHTISTSCSGKNQNEIDELEKELLKDTTMRGLGEVYSGGQWKSKTQ